MAVSQNNTARLAYIDNLRIFLTMLVMCQHIAIGLGTPGSWYYIVRDDPGLVTALILTVFVAVNQAFFMSLFFAVSAYFVPRSFDRKGPRRFLPALYMHVRLRYPRVAQCVDGGGEPSPGESLVHRRRRLVCLLPFIMMGMKLTGVLDGGFSVV